MINFWLDQYNYMRDLFVDYGYSYSGIYLAIVCSFVLIAIYERNNKGIRNYSIYISVFLAFFFSPSFMPSISKWLFEIDYVSEPYMIFPSILTTIISILVILNCCKEKDAITIKLKYISMIVILLVLVEASVPLQLSVQQFVIPSFRGKVESEVSEISEIIGNQSVILPSELQSELKAYNWNLYTPLEYNTDSEDSMAVVFGTASDSHISGVVIKHINNLGAVNDEDIKYFASEYKYKYVDSVSEYLIFKATE